MFLLFWNAVLIGFSGAAAPGPMSTATIGEALRVGPSAGVRVAIGHLLVELPLCCAIAWGLGPWLKQDPVFITVAVLGGLAMIGMGIGLWRDAVSAARKAMSTEVSAVRKSGGVVAGIVTTLGQPFFYVWWATIGAGLVAQGLAFGWWGVGVMYAGHWLADLIWFGFLGWVIGSGRHRLHEDWVRRLLRACGVVLVGLGIWFVVLGGSRLG